MITSSLRTGEKLMMTPMRVSAAQFARRTALLLSVVLVFAVSIFVIWRARDAILIMLVGILLGIIYDAIAQAIGWLVPWPRRLRLVLTFVLTWSLALALVWWGGATLVRDASQFLAAMQTLIRKLNEFLASGGFGLGLFPKGVSLTRVLPDAEIIFGGATIVITSVFGIAVVTIVIVFSGAFFSWEPQIYKVAVLSLLPRDKRSRVNDVLDKTAVALRKWIIGQSITMGVIFICSLPALWLSGMPFPLLLSVQAGLLVFIPTLGAFLAGVPIVLAGLSESVQMALHGLAIYVMIQFLETHLVTPIVQEHTVRIPPSLSLGVQLIMGLLFGLLGVAIAVPLAAAGKVFIEELYVIDQLGGPWEPDQVTRPLPARSNDAPA